MARITRKNLQDTPPKLRPPKRKCCRKPDIKNEGYVDVPKGRSWEYHCYSCGKGWTEMEEK